MKSQDPKEWNKAVKSVRLSDEEKNRIRNNLSAYMEFYPVREGEFGLLARGAQASGLGTEKSRRSLSQNFFGLFRHNKLVPAFAALVLILGGSLSAFAEGALPGSSLYSIKVNINEEIRGVFALSPESKASWETRRIERRLEETETLARSGTLTDEMRLRIEEHFAKHAERAEGNINKLAEADRVIVAIEASSHLESVLRAHTTVLADLGGSAESATTMALSAPAAEDSARAVSLSATAESAQGVSTPLEEIRSRVEERIQSVTEKRAGLEARMRTSNETANEMSARGKYEAAQNVILETQAFIEEHETRVTPQVAAQARASLALARDALTVGEAELEAASFSKAFVEFQKAIRLAQEAKLKLVLSGQLEARVPADFHFSDKGTVVESGTETSVIIATSSSQSRDGRSRSETYVEVRIDAKSSIDINLDQFENRQINIETDTEL